MVEQLIVLGCTVTSDEGFHFVMPRILNVDQLFTTTENIPTYHHDADRTDTHTSAAGVSNPKKKSDNPHPAVTLPTGQILFVHLLLKFKELLTVLEEPLLPAFVHQK